MTVIAMYIQYITLIFVNFLSLSLSQNNCSPQNCIVAQWTDWTTCTEECGNSGVQTRTRAILREANCGGICRLNTTEVTPCNRKCCPQNCEYTRWSKWMFMYISNATECDESGERFVFRRGRTMLKASSCGGYCDDTTVQVKCGELWCYKSCVLGIWSFWGECVGPCEKKGVRKRSKMILQQPACGGKECAQAEEEEECIAGCCPVDCQLGEWSSWSACNTTCGKSHRTRTRFVQQMECKGRKCTEEPTSEEHQDCKRYENINCVVGPWSKWGECYLHNGKCGEGTKNRSRSVLVKPECLGQPCPDLVEPGVCYGPCCIQDCVVSVWSNWSPCSSTCGKGVSTRTRDVSIQPSCNGSSCPILMESVLCEVTTKIDCKLSDWSVWSVCSTDCGKGSSFRSRRLLTPAYCGGYKCANMTLEDEKVCESYSASKDCLMSEWGAWEECIHDCDEGKQFRRRSVIQAAQCQGKQCPTTLDLRPCHMKCDHSELCNQGVCGCRPGFHLASDGYRCQPVRCVYPSIRYCPPDRVRIISCKYPRTSCSGFAYMDQCTIICPSGWVLKAESNTMTCLGSGTWSNQEVFCGPKNKAPYDMTVDNTDIMENTKAGFCVYLSTLDEVYDKQHYTILKDDKDMFTLVHNKMCLKRDADFEEKPTSWNVTVRCTDMEGLYVEKDFTFQILNENDPPKSASLTPDTVPENSLSGTHIGCLNATDDDPGQSVSLLLVDSEHKMFQSYRNGSQLCLKVLKQSDPLCATEGGNFCVLNMEKRKIHHVTLMAKDDQSPPGVSYFNLPITLTDANDKPTSVKLDPPLIPEEISPGEPLSNFVTEDEDENQLYVYEIMSDKTGQFSIKNGSLISNKKFDFEIEGSREYEILVKSTDNGSPPYSVTATITFHVDDVNEQPYDLHLSSMNSPLKFQVDNPQLKENARATIVGTLTVDDHDEGDRVVFSLMNDYNGKFVIMNSLCSPVPTKNVHCMATLVSFGSFNFEDISEVNLSVSATDVEGLELTVSFVLEILDMNDPPSDIWIDGQPGNTVTVKENHNNERVAQLTAVDEDSTDSHVYVLTDSAGGRFTISKDILMTSPAANLDFEIVSSYTVTIQVKDDGDPALSFEKQFTVNVTDQNEQPEDLRISSNEVPELSIIGYTVGKFDAIDPDNIHKVVQRFTYSLEDDSFGRFHIDHNELKVRKSTQLCNNRPCHIDFETESSMVVTVRVTDDGLPSLSFVKSITLKVLDENDPPQDIRLAGSTVRENSPAGIVIGKLTGVEQDRDQRLMFELLSNTDSFKLDKDYNLVALSEFDHESSANFSIGVRCTDDGQPSKSVDIVVNVQILDINEAPVFTNISNMKVTEQEKSGVVIGQVRAVDQDIGENLTFVVTKGFNSFTITDVKCTGKGVLGTVCGGSIVTKLPLDFEKEPQYTVTILVKDGRGLSDTQNVDISIQDINEPPTDILLNEKSLPSISVSEMTQDKVIAELSAIDPDPDQLHTFSIISKHRSTFDIVQDKLKVALGAILDFETTPTYTITLEALDSGSPPARFLKNITVIIRNINEVPQSLSLDNIKVPENSDIGHLIGHLLTRDPDNINAQTQTFSYELLTNDGGRFQIIDNQLQVGRSNAECLQNGGDTCLLNFEKSPSHNISIRVIDSGIPSQSAVLQISVDVTDTNDRPIHLALSGYKVDSSAKAGTLIGQFSVEDEDVGQTHSFHLSRDEGMFEVTKDGKLSKSKDQQLDTQTVYEIKVTAVDSGSPPMQTTSKFKITVTGGNEAPVSLNFTSTGGVWPFNINNPDIMENLPPDTVIGSLLAYDNGKNQQISFNLEVMKGQNPFKVSKDVTCTDDKGHTECSVNVLMKETLDFEEVQRVPVFATATDKDGEKLVEFFSVAILNQNEAPQDIIYSSPVPTVQENVLDEQLGVFVVHDPDIWDKHTFTLTDDADARFTLTSDGKLSSSKEHLIDFETNPELNISLMVVDSGRLTLNKSFLIKVMDVNEKPVKITLNSNKVKEMSSEGTVIGRLSTDDPDLNQTFIYILEDNANGRFFIDEDILKIADGGKDCEEAGGSLCLLDYETDTSHDIIITTQDSGAPMQSLTMSLTIDVDDVNDPPTNLALSSQSMQENVATGDVMATIEVENAEVDQFITYSLQGDVDTFYVEANVIKLKKMVDYESRKTYNLTVTASDNGFPQAEVSKSFEINVINVNEAPYGITVTSGNGVQEFPTNQPFIFENSPLDTLIGNIVVKDVDAADTVLFSTSSTYVGIFNQKCLPISQGVQCSADLRSAQMFDYEAMQSVDLEFIAVDKEGLSSTVPIKIQVRDANDPPKDINEGQSKVITVNEGSQDVILTTLHASDPDEMQAHVFTLLSETTLFAITGQELRVSPVAVLDYEVSQQHEVIIRATDNGTPPLHTEKTFIIKVENVNEAPDNIRLSKVEIAEGSASGTVVGVLSADDPDNIPEQKQNLTFTLVNSAENHFSLFNNQIMVNDGNLNYEDEQTYTIEVSVSDSGSPPLTATKCLTILVTDTNDPPMDLKLSSWKISENAATGTEVGTLSASDEDKGQSLTFTSSGTDYFVVAGNKLVLARNVDFEQTKSVTLIVEAMDDGIPRMKVSRTFTIAIEDTNDGPFDLKLTTVADIHDMAIPESFSVGDVIGELEVSDPDHVDKLKFHIRENTDNIFRLSSKFPECSKDGMLYKGIKIHGTKCIVNLELGKSLNFEEKSSPLRLRIIARDKGDEEITEQWTFTIANTNEPPTDITIDGGITEIPENMERFVIGALESVDEDEKDTHTYQLLSHWKLFTVDDNILQLTSPLNYEEKSSYSIKIRSTDNGKPKMHYSKTFNFQVVNVNEKPSSISITPNEVSNAAAINETVGLITVEDPDNNPSLLQSHKCQVGGEGLEIFTVDPESMKLKVISPVPLDRTEMMIILTCVDNGSPPAQLAQNITLVVKETVTIPKELKLLKQKLVPENEDMVVVGELQVVNQLNNEPVNDMFLFFLTDITAPFRVDGNILKTTEAFNYEKQPEIKVEITAMAFNSNFKTTFLIRVEDVNEAPTGIGIYGGGSVDENSLDGTVIGDLNTVDPERNQTYTYKIQSIFPGLENLRNTSIYTDLFVLSGRTLKVGLAGNMLNFEVNKVFSVIVTTTDSGSPPLSYTGTIPIVLKDVNDAPTDIILSQTQIQENSVEGSIVGSVNVVDEDEDDHHVCTIVDSKLPFQIENRNLVVKDNVLDFESNRKLLIEIECHDSGPGKLKFTKILIVNITNVNEPPSDIQITSQNIPENSPIGQVIGELSANDVDSKQVNFSIADNPYFILEGDNTLVTNTQLDYENVHQVSLKVTAVDTEGARSTEQIMIQIDDINEPPTDIIIDQQSVKESSPPETLVGTLHTTDPDKHQTFMYSLTEEGNNTDFFAIKGSNIVTGTQALDFEEMSEYKIYVKSTDDGVPSQTFTKEFIIKIEDINEAPIEIILDTIKPIPEDASGEMMLSNIAVNDPDTDQSHVCHLSDPSFPFTVSTNQDKEMQLYLTGVLDYERRSKYDFQIICSDGEFRKLVKTVITVEDVNERPTSIMLSGSHTVMADAVEGYVIGELEVFDPDNGQTHMLTVKGPNSVVVKIEEKMLMIKDPASLRNIAKTLSSLDVMVEALDNGIPVLSINKTFSLPITNTQILTTELPEITIDNQELPEDSEVGFRIGKLYDHNKTIENNVVFELTKNPGELFGVQDNMFLILLKNLTEVEETSRTVRVRVRNSDTFESEFQDITIFIKRINTCVVNGTTCHENARCVKNASTGQHVCECEKGFIGNGYSCENINDCVGSKGGNPCLNDGQCIDEINGYACICQEGYLGQNCEISKTVADVDICNEKPCKNAGVCVSDDQNSNFTCLCQPGWEGQVCDRSKNDCIRSLCHGNSACVDKHLTYVCKCASDRYGSRCQYMSGVCDEDTSCEDSTDICVPKTDSFDFLCANISCVVDLLIKQNDTISDMPEFTARISDKILEILNQNRILPAVKKRTKRQTSEFEIFMISVQQVEEINIQFVVWTHDTVYTKEEVYEMLLLACSVLGSFSLTETEVCPTMQQGQSEPDISSKPQWLIPVIAGSSAALVFVTAIIIVLCMRKKKTADDNKDYKEIMNKFKDADLDTISRRSSGYSSISKKKSGGLKESTVPAEDVHVDDNQ